VVDAFSAHRTGSFEVRRVASSLHGLLSTFQFAVRAVEILIDYELWERFEKRAISGKRLSLHEHVCAKRFHLFMAVGGDQRDLHVSSLGRYPKGERGARPGYIVERRLIERRVSSEYVAVGEDPVFGGADGRVLAFGRPFREWLYLKLRAVRVLGARVRIAFQPL
jgi:hypothetical protein